MFETFFEMKHTPFARNLPTEALFESAEMGDTLGRLSYAADHQLFAVVTANAGCGKSTLIRKFVSSLPVDEYITMYISDSKLTPRWFYKGMIDQLGGEAKFYRGDSKRILHHEIEVLRCVKHRRVVSIVDEAHLLEKETIEEIRFLLNYTYDSESPMALILVGQSELWDKLKMKQYEAVRQRIDINCVLHPLDRSGTESYIKTHLNYAEGRTEIFTDKAFDEIFKISSGIPRMINRVSEKSLMYAFQQHKFLIDEHMVQYVAEHEMLGVR